MPHPGCSTPSKETHYPLYRRLGGPQGLSGWVRKILPPPGFDPQTINTEKFMLYIKFNCLGFKTVMSVKIVVVGSSGLLYCGLVGGYCDSTLRVKVVYSSEILVPFSQTTQCQNPSHSVLKLLIHILYYGNSFN